MMHVLVVDDDPELLQYITTTLSRGGIPAIGAHSGDEAIAVLHRRGREIRMVLTDIVMPRMTGLDLATKLVESNPNLPVVFMTGYKTDHLEQFAHSLKGREVLGKPFTPAELLGIVKVALKGSEKAKSA